MPMQSGDVSTEFLRKLANSYGDVDDFYKKLTQSNPPVFAFLGSTGTGFVVIGSSDVDIVYNNNYNSDQYPMVF